MDRIHITRGASHINEPRLNISEARRAQGQRTSLIQFEEPMDESKRSILLAYQRLCSILRSYKTSTVRTLSRIPVSDTLSWNRTLTKLSVATRW